jgi:hypothetical protein
MKIHTSSWIKTATCNILTKKNSLNCEKQKINSQANGYSHNNPDCGELRATGKYAYLASTFFVMVEDKTVT